MVSIPLERIRAEAKTFKFWRTVALAIAAVLFFVGWVTGKVFSLLWFVAAWCFAAVRIGWRDARRKDA